MNRHLISVVVAAAMLALVLSLGCGGGGGGGGGGTSKYNPIRATIVDSSGRFVDSSNLVAGKTYQMQIIGFDSSSAMVTLSPSTWSTTAPASVAAVTTVGAVTTVAAASGNYTVSGRYNNVTYTATLGVHSGLATVTGYARTLGGVPIGGAIIEFYSSTGTMVGSTRTGTNGTFISNVPTTAKSFSASVFDLTGYYDQFTYNGGGYSHAVAGCRASLPALTAGAASALKTDVVIYKSGGGQPPPPPPDCLNS